MGNLDPSNLRLLTLTRVTKRLSAASRNFNSNKMKTTRTKIVCLIWLANCKLRSRLVCYLDPLWCRGRGTELKKKELYVRSVTRPSHATHIVESLTTASYLSIIWSD